jgi:hypothetical protein
MPSPRDSSPPSLSSTCWPANTGIEIRLPKSPQPGASSLHASGISCPQVE